LLRVGGTFTLAALVAAGCTSGSSSKTAASAATAAGSGSTPASVTTTKSNASDSSGRYKGFEVIPSIVQQVEPQVVTVKVPDGLGSGVIWNKDGVIVTNHHVVPSDESVQVTFADGKEADAKLIATDAVLDLSVIQVDRKGLPAATFADALPTVGELAIAMGSPLGFEDTVTAGIISGLHRNIPGSAQQSQSLVDLVQTDAPISPGNSGGALVNGEGKVIGINVAYIPPQAEAVSIGFAIPAPTVTDAVQQLLANGRVKHAYLGIQPAPLTPQVVQQLGVGTDQGVLVLDVVQGGPAAQAGMQPGDVITEFDGKSVATEEDFLAELRKVDPGQPVKVVVKRGSQDVNLTVTLADRPPATGG
jgi:S1-C subfamily serine protease